MNFTFVGDMPDIRKIDRSSSWLLIVTLTFCLFPWHGRSSTWGIVALMLHFIMDPSLFRKLRRFYIQPAALVGMFFLFYHVLALLWTDYPKEGWKSIEVKLAFFILPVLFSMEHYLNYKTFKNIFFFFLISCSFAFLYELGHSFYYYHNQGAFYVLDRMNLSKGLMHPGYFSNFFTLGVVVLSYDWIESKKISKLYLFFLFYFLGILAVLVSKTALLFLAFFGMYIIWKLSAFIKNIPLRLAAVVISTLVCLSIFVALPPIRGRIIETWQERNAPITNPEFRYSTISRRAAWKLEGELIAARPILGYGTGEANPLLIQKFKDYRYDDLIKFNMHTHNQVLRTWIDLGILGVTILIGFIVALFIAFVKKKDGIGFWMTLLLLLNILTDDALEIQSVGVFFLFVIFLMLYKKTKKRIRLYN